ncbi:hypothetical protein EC957_010563 [Mortierella hygrophila]|uniref:Uncharacterized protein n=1 Tax=Mortierella hygrophila TaxID=979708 RepID=A0A9P6FAN6_9FUNG|nr:hypothetical protein EC957_010563 [Mortierella hygrophila]
MATTAVTPTPTQTKLQVTDADERDGFVEYCKMRTCERMEAERTDGNLQHKDLLGIKLMAVTKRHESGIEKQEKQSRMSSIAMTTHDTLLRLSVLLESDRAKTGKLEEADVDQMRVIAIESKIEWRGFTDEMKMFWIERGSVKSTLNAWGSFLKTNNATVPEVHATGPARPPSNVHPHHH